MFESKFWNEPFLQIVVHVICWQSKEVSHMANDTLYYEPNLALNRVLALFHCFGNNNT